jgi:GAF domain-containing protein
VVDAGHHLMEFDERLQRAFDALAESLHQEIAARLNATRVDLAGSVQEERDVAITLAANEARSAAEQDLGKQTADAVCRAEHDVRAKLTEAHDAATERLLEAVRAIDGARGLSEILDALVDAAAADGGRAAVFLPQGTALKSWRLVGFDRAHGAGSSVELSFADGGLIAEAGETGRPARLDPGAPRQALVPSFVDLPEQSRAVAVPLVMSEQVFAILYVDEGHREPAAREAWPATIEILARHAARALESVTASRFAQVAEGSRRALG